MFIFIFVNKNGNDTFSLQLYKSTFIIPPLKLHLRPLILSKLLGFVAFAICFQGVQQQ